MTFHKKAIILCFEWVNSAWQTRKTIVLRLVVLRQAEHILFEVFGIFTFEMSPDIHTSSTTSCVAQWSAAYNCINNFRFRSVCSLCMCVRGTHQRSPIPMLFSSQSEATELGDRISSGSFLPLKQFKSKSHSSLKYTTGCQNVLQSLKKYRVSIKIAR